MYDRKVIPRTVSNKYFIKYSKIFSTAQINTVYALLIYSIYTLRGLIFVWINFRECRPRNI